MGKQGNIYLTRTKLFTFKQVFIVISGPVVVVMAWQLDLCL